MAQEKPVTPEKQLLNLIEKPMAQSTLQAAAIKYHGRSLFSFGALKGRFAFFKNRVDDFKAGGVQQLDLGLLNEALIFCVFILASYLIISSAMSIVSLKKGLNLNVKIEKAPEVKVSQIASFLKSASYYLEKARERDIFKMGANAPAPQMGVASRGPSQRIIEATQDLRLVGISWSDDPDIMIENTKSQKTYFLKKGQTIDNEIKVKAVFKDKVILSYLGEEIELR